MKKFYLLALPVLAFAAPAQAQDTSGFRVELVGALDKIKPRLGVDSDEFNPNDDTDVDAAYGVGVGFDFLNSPALRVGVDLEFTETTAARNFIDNDNVVGEAKFGTDLYAGGRVTVPLGRFSLVGKVGYTAFEVETNITAATFVDPFKDNDRLKGIRGAVGFQYTGDETDRVYYGLEFRYSDYEKNVTRHQVALVLGTRF
jgi:outer membrane immunogenic protein